MLRRILLISALLSSVSFSAFAQGAPAPAGGTDDGPGKHFNFLIGQKMMDSKDWGKDFKAAGLPAMDSQTSFGLASTFGNKWPVGIAFDLLYSTKSGKSPALGRTVTGSVLEVGLGARKHFDLGALPVVPYAGLGLAYGAGTVTCSGCTSQSPSGIGLFVNTGAFYRVSKFNAGLDLRYSTIDGKDGDIKLKVGGINIGLLLGMGF